ncbi:MAG: ABC transporter substrate-binding protein [Dehalococcoidia bacterium]|nr:ABC transporter substrate-binding protein [Dehalococcoidia bacterium]
MATQDPMFLDGLRRGRSRRDFLRLALAAPLLVACGTSDVDRKAAKRRELLGPLPTLRNPSQPSQARRGTLRLGATPATLPAVLGPLISAQLCAVDPRTGDVYGDLAERVELAGELDVVFTLREDARFHPGADGLAAALTSEDVRRDFAARAAVHEFLFTEVIDAVEAPSLRTVVLRLKAPFGTLFESLANPAQAAVRGGGRYAVLDMPLGAGPFIPGGIDGETLLLGANQLYHRAPLPFLEGVTIDVRPDQATLEGLARDGGVDVQRFTGTTAGPQGLAMRRATRPSRGLVAVALSSAAVRGARTSSQPAIFQDDRVRRAISLSIDRDALLRRGDVVATGPVGPAFGPDALETNELRSHALFRRNPQAARGLLDAAGQAELAFTMIAPDTAEARELLPDLQRQLAEAEFRMRPSLVSTREWEASLRSGDFEAALFESPDLQMPDAGLRLHTSGGPSGTFSPWGYSNPVYDSAVRTALSALGPTHRAERSRAAQRILLDSVPALLPLTTRIEDAWVSTGLQGFEWDAHGFNDGWLAATWRFAKPAKRRP